MVNNGVSAFRQPKLPIDLVSDGVDIWKMRTRVAKRMYVADVKVVSFHRHQNTPALRICVPKACWGSIIKCCQSIAATFDRVGGSALAGLIHRPQRQSCALYCVLV